MRTQTLTKQVIAFLAAVLLVFTVIYIVVLWRNQSADRVLALGAGQLLYQTPDVAIGITRDSEAHASKVTLLRFSMDGGWVIAGAGRWIPDRQVHRFANIMLLPDQSDGPAGAMWLCAIRTNPSLSAIDLVDPSHTHATQSYAFHRGGIVEPAVVTDTTILEGLAGSRVVFRIPYASVN